MTNEMHYSYNFYSTVFIALHVSKEFTRSSSGAQHNIPYHAVWYNHAGESSCYAVVGKLIDAQQAKGTHKYKKHKRNCTNAKLQSGTIKRAD